MPLADFEQLCLGFCELAGLQPPALVPDMYGSVAFSARMRGVPITVLELEQTRGQLAFLVACMGPLSPAGADASAEGLRLMDANSPLPVVDAPRFSRNPRTGEAMMQWPCRLQSVSSADVYRRVMLMTDVALGWQRDRSLGPWGAASPPISRADAGPSSFDGFGPPTGYDHAAELRDTERFHALYEEISAALEQPPEPAPLSSGARSFELHIDGVNAVVAHLPSRRPGMALVGVPFGVLPQASPQACVAAMLDANFVLATQPHGAAFCRDAATGDLLLRYAYPLVGARGRHCLTQLSHLVAFVHEWTSLAGDAAAFAASAVAPSMPTPGCAEYA